MIKQRDILLVPFPFSNQSGKKFRPVVVISNNNFNDYSEDILVVGITSNISKDKYTILLNKDKLEEGDFSIPCCIKVENILKIDKGLIIRKIGKIKPKILDELSFKLTEILKLDK